MLSKEREIRHWLQVIVHAEQSSNISKTCRYYGISRQTFYKRKRRYEKGKNEPTISMMERLIHAISPDEPLHVLFG